MPQPSDATDVRHVILCVGAKHGGKTTAMQSLAERAVAQGRTVRGLLAPSVCENRQPIGYDVVDLSSGRSAVLARRGREGPEFTGEFTFDAEGLSFGRAVLANEASFQADLVIVDEFGPLELKGRGWRREVDALAARAGGTVLLVVRRRLAEQVARLYSVPPSRVVDVHSDGLAAWVLHHP